MKNDYVIHMKIQIENIGEKNMITTEMKFILKPQNDTGGKLNIMIFQKKYDSMIQNETGGKKLKNDLEKNADKIQDIQQKIEVKKKVETQQKIASIKLGDRVRIKGSTSVGTIEKIEDEVIHINYGKFLTKISIFEIEKI